MEQCSFIWQHGTGFAQFCYTRCAVSCPVSSLPSSCFKSKWPRSWCVKLRHYLCLADTLMGVKGRPMVTERGQVLSQGQEGAEGWLGLVGQELQRSSLKQQELRWERGRQLRGQRLKKPPKSEGNQDRGSIKVTTERCWKGQAVSEL